MPLLTMDGHPDSLSKENLLLIKSKYKFSLPPMINRGSPDDWAEKVAVDGMPILGPTSNACAMLTHDGYFDMVFSNTLFTNCRLLRDEYSTIENSSIEAASLRIVYTSKHELSSKEQK